ncbi:hypothetical protein ABEB36_009563 [Hypothenemus hampei]|uniref:Uncharacterized protein n=1 Tax=Hypothenemus hampei TaxID=57062 RepID=A0ABD1EH35_HYPHA
MKLYPFAESPGTWSRSNGLRLNPKKTVVMHFGLANLRSRGLEMADNVMIDDIVIEVRDGVRNLGVVFDFQLDF